MRKIAVIFFSSLTGALLNVALSVLLCQKLQIPLYLDTILTITITLNQGLLSGALTGALTNIINESFRFWGWEGYLFALCNIATAVISHLFIRFFPVELNLLITGDATAPGLQQAEPARGFPTNLRQILVMDRVIVLILLSFSLCIAISILGGLLTVFIDALRNNPEFNPASMVLSRTMFVSVN